MTLKQNKSIKKNIGNNTFYIRPFSAFKAANLSGELISTLTPVLSAIIPLIGSSNEKTDVRDLIPMLSESLSTIDGDKIESLMEKLLIENNNISIVGEITDKQALPLDEDLVNEVFCGEVDNLYVLCYEVIMANYSGFFEKLGLRFGNRQDTEDKKTIAQRNMES